MRVRLVSFSIFQPQYFFILRVSSSAEREQPFQPGEALHSGDLGPDWGHSSRFHSVISAYFRNVQDAGQGCIPGSGTEPIQGCPSNDLYPDRTRELAVLQGLECG